MFLSITLILPHAKMTIPAPPTSNPFSSLIEQEVAVVPRFTFESGVELTDIPVAYKTWGKLNAAGDNCLVICHALTGSADMEDWCVLVA